MYFSFLLLLLLLSICGLIFALLHCSISPKKYQNRDIYKIFLDSAVAQANGMGELWLAENCWEISRFNEPIIRTYILEPKMISQIRALMLDRLTQSSTLNALKKGVLRWICLKLMYLTWPAIKYYKAIYSGICQSEYHWSLPKVSTISRNPLQRGLEFLTLISNVNTMLS